LHHSIPEILLAAEIKNRVFQFQEMVAAGLPHIFHQLVARRWDWNPFRASSISCNGIIVLMIQA